MPKSIRLLVVDNCPVDADLVVRALIRFGYEPTWERVDTEHDYLVRLDSSLDLILAEYTLPEFHALGALQHLRERRLDVPLIIVTGLIREEVAVAAVKQGVAD